MPVVLLSAEAYRDSGSEEGDGKPPEHSLMFSETSPSCFRIQRQFRCAGGTEAHRNSESEEGHGKPPKHSSCFHSIKHETIFDQHIST
jgi:hypothetical protein